MLVPRGGNAGRSTPSAEYGCVVIILACRTPNAIPVALLTHESFSPNSDVFLWGFLRFAIKRECNRLVCPEAEDEAGEPQPAPFLGGGPDNEKLHVRYSLTDGFVCFDVVRWLYLQTMRCLLTSILLALPRTDRHRDRLRCVSVDFNHPAHMCVPSDGCDHAHLAFLPLLCSFVHAA